MNLQTPFRLEQYLISPLEHCVQHDEGEACTLQPKFIEVLAYLASQFPRVVTREELIEKIWDSNHYVGEKALTNAVWNLRKALKVENNPVIETIRKTGYRLLLEPSYQQETIASVQPDDNTKQHKIKSPVYIGVSIIFAILFCGAVFSLYWHGMNQNPSSATLTSLTSEPGRELFPSLSNDQRYLLYSWRQITRDADLFIKDLSQPDLPPRQLTFTKASEGAAIWGKGSGSIYFYRKYRDNPRCHIVKMTLATAQEEVIATCPSNINIYLALSADGNSLAFTGYEREFGTGIYFKDLNNDDKAPQRFSCKMGCEYSDRSISFSPNGKYAGVTRRIEERVEDIFLIDLANNSESQLTFGEGDIKGLTWSSDSTKVIYGAKSSLYRQGYVVDIETKEITSLHVDGLSFPSRINGTNDVVFHRWLVPAYLSYMPLNDDITATPFPLIQSDFSHASAHYNELNKRLVYVSNESGFNEVWTASTDGTARKKLTQLENNLTNPQWSHDGRSISFLATLSNKQTSKVYILDVATRQVKELVTDFDVQYRSTWSQDDKSIIAAAKRDGRTKLYRIPINGDEPIILLNSRASYAIETADNKLWFSKGSNRGLWVIDLNKGSKPLQVLDKEQFTARYNWTVANDGVYFQTDLRDSNLIEYYDFATKQIKAIARLPVRTISRFGTMYYLEKQKKLIFTQYQYPLVDIKRLSHPALN